ncbi:hypothetical protein SAMN05216475_5476 [Pseudomonas synxantha]|uniref:Uncharacterized protein n=1 Tax=Pseudomonas synxantha TaxID=47883 RepID=A0AAX3IFF6_9PSED|nr:hypothetical protein C4K01_5669 [Pseudomonas synxantha]MDQ0977786.1 hypothetical protein [Pseudomonas synxantha]SDU62605.1 hypothetical protein SAMN05216475_5476 [Pseudomonas synxantha]VTR05657.1 Uncharacterised protein [Pseudomonas synxantha]
MAEPAAKLYAPLPIEPMGDVHAADGKAWEVPLTRL